MMEQDPYSTWLVSGYILSDISDESKSNLNNYEHRSPRRQLEMWLVMYIDAYKCKYKVHEGKVFKAQKNNKKSLSAAA